MSTKPHIAYRPDIDGLRAFAILVVVIFHAFPGKLNGGFVGVDVFFVISGFLISSIIFQSLDRGSFSIRDFYVRRINRIFPALIIVLAFCFVAGWFVLLPDEFKQLGLHIASGAGFIQNITLVQESGYFDRSSELKPLLHLWSLAIEEQYYVFYPLLMWAAWRMGRYVLGIIALLAVGSFALNIGLIANHGISTFFLPHTRVWELLAGGLLAYLMVSLKDKPVLLKPFLCDAKQPAITSNLASAFGLLLLVASVFAIQKGDLFPGWWALAPVAGTWLIIFAGPNAWVNKYIMGNKLMIFVGLISYPLYLWHWPLLSFAVIMESELPSIGIRTGAVVLSFFFAWLTYRLIERPIRTWQKTQFKVAALSLLLAVVGVVGFAAYMKDGLAFRMKNKHINATIEKFRWVGPAAYCDKVNGLPNMPDKCIVSDASKKPSVALIGDSHAGSIYYGIASEYLKRGKSLLLVTDGGCPPLYDVQFANEKQRQNCTSVIDPAFNYISSNPSVQTVVLSMLGGPAYIHGQRASKENNTKSVNGWQGGTANDVLAQNLSDTLDRLTSMNKEVIFILDWPDLMFNPESCIDSRPLRITNRIKNPCAISRQEYDSQVIEYRSLILSVLDKHPSVKVFDASRHLCDEYYCWGMKDGNPLYWDRDHLSVYGSEYVADKFFKDVYGPSTLLSMQ